MFQQTCVRPCQFTVCDAKSPSYIWQEHARAGKLLLSSDDTDEARDEPLLDDSVPMLSCTSA